jgi:hypothetical protein
VKATTARATITSSSGVLSADGHFVVFMSLSNNLVAGNTNGYAHIFLASTGR